MPMPLAIRPTKKTHTCACLVTARPHPLRGSQRPGPRPGKGCMCILTPAQDGRRKDACIGSLANLTTRPFCEFCHGGFLLRVLRRSYRATLSIHKLSPKTSCSVQLTTRKPARGRLVQQKTAASAVAMSDRSYFMVGRATWLNCRSNKTKTASPKVQTLSVSRLQVIRPAGDVQECF